MDEAYEISFLIPAFNEAGRILHTLERIRGYAESNFHRWEIIVIDDGSRDQTVSRVKRYFETCDCKHPLRLIVNKTNRGKGYSVQQGFFASRGRLVLFSDSDLSTPIEETDKLREALEKGNYDGVIASRAVQGSQIVVHQPFFREWGGKCFNLLIRLLTWLPFHDTQCGFKLFRRQSFLPVFQQQTIDRYSFDVEILFIARRSGLRVAEIPVIWAHCTDSKVHFLRDAIRMFREVFAIRRRAWKGLYQFSNASSGAAGQPENPPPAPVVDLPKIDPKPEPKPDLPAPPVKREPKAVASSPSKRPRPGKKRR